jgi:hypothetical protein
LELWKRLIERNPRQFIFELDRLLWRANGVGPLTAVALLVRDPLLKQASRPSGGKIGSPVCRSADGYIQSRGAGVGLTLGVVRGRAVGVGLGVELGVTVGVELGVAVGVTVAVAVGVDVGVIVAVGVAEAVAVAVGVGEGAEV